MANLIVLQSFVKTLRESRGDIHTRIRLAECIRANIKKDPALLEKLGLSQRELNSFPHN